MNIAVYCSSSNNIDECYTNEAYKLGEWIAQNGHTLVFGGATGGSMSAVSEGAYSKNGKIIGVIPDAVVRMHRKNPLCTELLFCETMDERKRQMKLLADVFIILPGSYGTLDEYFDVLASGIVGEHSKRCIVINQEGFYNTLFSLTTEFKEKGFIPATHQNYEALVVNNVEMCAEILQRYI